MKKGFTLIELLAVIVILAIIAVIATPIVLNIINDTKESAILRSADFYLDGVETAIATSVLKGITVSDGIYSIMEDGNVCIGTLSESGCTGDALKIEIDGEKPTSGTIEISGGSISSVDLVISDKDIWNNSLSGNLEYKLAPGLYDEDNNLLISWEDLISTNYQSITWEEYYYDEETGEEGYKEVPRAILNVDENGVLTSAIDYTAIEENHSAKYLVGKLVIDDSVTKIGYQAFWDCIGLTSIIIPESVTKIESQAFGWSGLKSIMIPESVTKIEIQAFWGCNDLTRIKVDKNNPVYDSRANSNAIIETLNNNLIVSCKGTVIPNSITSIGERGFQCSDSSLTSIIIPNSVTSIGDYAFVGCTGLSSITIPSSVTSIGRNAFTSCKESITINYSGTEIEWNAISKGEKWDYLNYNTVINKVINYNYKG